MALHNPFNFLGKHFFTAHRGGLPRQLAANSSPKQIHRYENTLEAFRNAIDAGVRSLETDCHVTADGVLVAFHDDRLPNGKKISSLTWEQLNKEYPQIPQMKEVVVLARDNDAVLTIDAKNADKATIGKHNGKRNHILLIDLLFELGMQDRVIVGGFSGKRTNQMREHAKRLRNKLLEHLGRQQSSSENSEEIQDVPEGIATSPAFGGLIGLLAKRFVYEIVGRFSENLQTKLLTSFEKNNKYAAYQMPAKVGIDWRVSILTPNMDYQFFLTKKLSPLSIS